MVDDDADGDVGGDVAGVVAKEWGDWLDDDKDDVVEACDRVDGTRQTG